MASGKPAEHRGLDVDAGIVFHLGAGLISDDVQALAELVKNSYDADATWVRVDIHSNDEPCADRPSGEGCIVVSDDGNGMTDDDIRSGWLTIAASPKRETRRAGRTSPGGRVPLGEKGLGRLGTQRLGTEVHIVTRPVDEPGVSRKRKPASLEHEVAFSWRDCRPGVRLSDVPVNWERKAIALGGATAGTVLTVSGLARTGSWRDDRDRISSEMSKLLSPYEVAKDFKVLVTIDGERIDLETVDANLRQAAVLTYHFAFDGQRLELEGRVKLAYLSPGRELRRAFQQSIESDEGRGLLPHLRKELARRGTEAEADKAPWYLRFRRAIAVDELSSLRRDESGGEWASPGPFHGEMDAFPLGADDGERGDAFGSLSEFRGIVKRMSGIRVYRDGFNVRTPHDWLGLAQSWTGGKSWYTLRPDNTLGYVAISARDNRALQEKTDREGFVDNASFQNFRQLLKHIVRWANDAQDAMRRGANDFMREAAQKHGPELADASPMTVAGSLIEAGERHRPVRERLEIMLRDPNQSPSNPKPDGTDAAAEIAELGRYEAEVTSAAQVLVTQIGALQSRVDDLYELASLGLAAEAWAHEVQYVTDRLTEVTRRLRAALDKGEVPRIQLRAFSEHIHTSIRALRRQLAYLAPALRYVRENRSRIDVGAYLADEFAPYHRQRLNRNGIELVVRRRGAGLVVLLNLGKLTQVFDNLLHNSEYWVREAIRRSDAAHGEITIDVEPPRVRVRDSGPGVPTAVEGSLFEPFISTKPPGEGRGLGLFVTRQLLEPEGCTISLLPERNSRGRRFIFEVNLGGAIDDGSDGNPI